MHKNGYIFDYSKFHSGIRVTQNCFQKFWKQKIDKIRLKPYVYRDLAMKVNDFICTTYITLSQNFKQNPSLNFEIHGHFSTEYQKD